MSARMLALIDVIIRYSDSKFCSVRMSLSIRRYRTTRTKRTSVPSGGRDAFATMPEIQQTTMMLSSQFHESLKKSARQAASLRPSSTTKMAPKSHSKASKTFGPSGQKSEAFRCMSA